VIESDLGLSLVFFWGGRVMDSFRFVSLFCTDRLNTSSFSSSVRFVVVAALRSSSLDRDSRKITERDERDHEVSERTERI
jgi:hypothetical protein